MNTKKFRNCHATITTFDCGTEVMTSYSTPIFIIQDGTVVACNLNYSRTTSRQITWYLREKGSTRNEVKMINKDDFVSRLRNLGITFLGWL